MPDSFFFDKVVKYLTNVGNLLQNAKTEFQAIENKFSTDGMSKEVIQRVNRTVINGMDATIKSISAIMLDLNKEVEAGEREDLSNLPSKQKRKS